VLIHQPHGGAQGQTTDIELAAKEMSYMRHRMNEILAEHTGQPLDRIVKDTDRDYILRGDEAVSYGLIDAVLSHRELREVTAITA
jgi:ATP-dependent Clp protease protease subunit